MYYGININVLSSSLGDVWTNDYLCLFWLSFRKFRMDERSTKEETKSLNETKEEKKPTHLDGGYGWVVVAACFVVHILQIGYLRAFGLLFVKFLAEFKAPASYTSTIMGIQSAIFSLTSLLVLSILIDYWSIRGYAVLGSILTSSGVAISYFAENIEFLIFSQSLGNAFTYGPGIVLIGRYFKKRLALANSLANAGASAGAVIIPIIIPLFMDEFGLRGGLLNLGGVMAQVIICTALYRDPGKHPEDESAEVHVEDFKSLESFYSLPEQVISKDKVVDATPVSPHSDKDNIYHFTTDRNIFRERTLSNRSYQSDLVKPLNSPPMKHNTFLIEQSDDNGHLRRKTHLSESHSIVDTLSRSRMLLYASNPNLVYASIVDLKATVEPCTSEETEKERDNSKLLSKLKNILDLSLFKNPVFWVVAGFTPTCMCGSALAAAFIPALGVELGLEDSQTSLLLTISGALDIVSRIVPGVLAELNVMRTPHMVAISTFTLGVIFQFVRFFDTYALMIVLACLYGILGGVYFSLLAVVIIELMGFESFTKVFGFVQVFHGASAAICYPVLDNIIWEIEMKLNGQLTSPFSQSYFSTFALGPALLFVAETGVGGLRDVTGTYVTCFHFLGACAIVGSIILALEPLARKKQASKQRNGKTQYDIVPSNDKTKSNKESV
ncbi:hypothetical protein LOTGIDRAFT_167211 [Lottia gigantea]|uniref:Major facilitator superfamily (MFS) profile domain-containing protein n=1 Tax=Lottia gigantea TaxID=225164 RepID=V3Z6J6_LOTGI|nr:hypothetical protein LOTGIDRAFT_167211 [Lottia gigantea]ESO86388.1 hypothetical protein LOTGIDRAFT_167211 [Lottia gigantea]